VARLTSEVKASHLLHLAWYVEHGKFWDAPENELWLEASKTLFEQFAAAGGRRIVAAGTCAEYDWKLGASRFVEGSSSIAPLSRYGSAKNSLHQHLAELADRSGITYAWGRIFYVFGPGENADRFVPTAIKAILRNETPVCNSPGDVRDLTYVEDVAAAFAQILASDVAGAINISSGNGLRLDMLIKQIIGQSASNSLSENFRSSATGTTLIGANDRLIKEVGFTGWTEFDTALMRTIDWWRSPRPEADEE
jgi:nucleoside-diphosphate-sugar epimerase